jgi:hypothetical protein
MTQVVNVEPEYLSRSHSVDMRTRRYPVIGTPEHTALVNAIRLNFPEIYDEPNDTETGQQLFELGVWNSAIHPPPCA